METRKKRPYRQEPNPSYYIFVTTNKITHEYYVGYHVEYFKSFNPNFYGHNTYLKQDLKKYGKENFEVKVLKYFNTYEEMIEHYKSLLTDELVDDPQSYNTLKSLRGRPVSKDPIAMIEKRRKYYRHYYRSYNHS